MVLEATVVCLDNSEWMRNGDYTPTRLEAQQDAINLICGAKTQSNPENTVAVVACSGRNPEVLVTLTGDLGKVLSSLHGVKVGTHLNFQGGIQVAQLALKHRHNKHQHQRVIFFVGSPIESSSDDLVRLGKRLRKNGVAVDVVNFGEEAQNTEKLEAFIGAVSNNDNSHLVTIPPGPHILSDILLSSPIITGEEGGAGGEGGAAASRGDFGFGVDPNMDPELALALKVSLEEEKARQEMARKKEEDANKSSSSIDTSAPSTSSMPSTSSNPVSTSADTTMTDLDDDLAEAIRLSMQGGAPAAPSSSAPPSSSAATPNQSKPSADVIMNEDDDEMQLALQLSMQEGSNANRNQTSSTSTSDVNRVMEDPNFVNSVLASLPGVDPNDERIKNALASLKKPEDKKDEKK